MIFLDGEDFAEGLITGAITGGKHLGPMKVWSRQEEYTFER